MEPAHAAELQAALEELMRTAGIDVPEDGITPEHIQQISQKIKALMAKNASAATPIEAAVGDASLGAGGGVVTPFPRAGKHQNVLLAGQLGIIVHQLRQAITKLGGEVTIAQDVDDAISEYQKRDYSLVIIDLFMPTDREGLIVLEEIRRISVVCQINTQILILAPQVKDKGVRELCKSKGATFFLEKQEGWHKTILQYYAGEITEEAS